MSMKILWISQNLPFPPKTGVLQRNYNLIREASQFADIHLVAILKQDILPNFDGAVAERELGKLCRRVTVVELPTETSRTAFLWVLVKSLFTRNPFTVNWANSAGLRKILRDAVAAERYDLVFFDTISLADYRGLARKSVRVLNHHNVESHLFDRRLPYERNPLKRFYLGMEARKLRNYEAAHAAEFDMNVMVSELDGVRLQEICPPARVAVVANGVDVSYFQSSEGGREPGHLIMVSGMNWFPNKDAVLFMAQDIWPLLTQVAPQVKLTIVGASPPQQILDLAARDPRVTVTGFVDDVRPYMERAQIYLCPMRDGGGTRLKILDALSMGLPIVATTMALEGIHVEPERDVLTADAPAQFVHQIQRLLGDGQLRMRLGASGRAFAERHFSWPVVGRRMQDMFKELAEAKQP
jgi:polysaccharide biosynthesis protein PslH